MEATVINFANDYSYTAAPEIMKALAEPLPQALPSYGADTISENARSLIREAIRKPHATAYFLAGGTQTNALALDTLLPRYSSVIAADTGHIATYEAGAIEFTGHKIETLPGHEGKISADQVTEYMRRFTTSGLRNHMPQPGLVYISYPTELGTLYTAAELRAMAEVCHSNDLLLYLDGARMAYGLASPHSDVSLPIIAECCDAFCIGGTKCGAMFGEALVFSHSSTVPDNFATSMRQHGALLAKGWLVAQQFTTLLENDLRLYMEFGRHGVEYAAKVQAVLGRHGIDVAITRQTNQVFAQVSTALKQHMARSLAFTDWGWIGDITGVIRLVTGRASAEADIEGLERSLTDFTEL